MDIIREYFEVVDLCFTTLPMTSTQHITEKIMSKYPVTIENYQKKAWCIIVKVADGIYGYSWVCTHPKYQGQGYGRKLFETVTKKYKGIFITKAIKESKTFYEKLGWTPFFDDGERFLLIYANSREKVVY